MCINSQKVYLWERSGSGKTLARIQDNIAKKNISTQRKLNPWQRRRYLNETLQSQNSLARRRIAQSGRRIQGKTLGGECQERKSNK